MHFHLVKLGVVITLAPVRDPFGDDLEPEPRKDGDVARLANGVEAEADDASGSSETCTFLKQ